MQGVETMRPFKISLDKHSYRVKPTDREEIGQISIRIGNNPVQVNSSNIREIVKDIATNGCSFAPATFHDELRRKDNFKQMQLLPLDFDGTISYEDYRKRAERYELKSLFEYETLTSTDKNMFRVCFLNSGFITDIKGTDIIMRYISVSMR